MQILSVLGLDTIEETETEFRIGGELAPAGAAWKALPLTVREQIKEALRHIVGAVP